MGFFSIPMAVVYLGVKVRFCKILFCKSSVLSFVKGHLKSVVLDLVSLLGRAWLAITFFMSLKYLQFLKEWIH